MRSLPLVLLLAACGPQVGEPVGDDTDAADTGLADTADTSDPPDTVPPPEPTFSFIALGDAGTGSEAQHAVADVIAEVCARPDRPCQMALYLGDNIYNSGAEDYDDEQFQTKFEAPYEDLDFPFYAVLGNHDLGGEGLGLDLNTEKAAYQIAWSDVSTKWRMPDRYYVVPESVVSWDFVKFIGLETTEVFFGLHEAQQDWFELETMTSTARWTIAFAHHPYISNGQHGDAGTYEGIPASIPYTTIPRGQHIKEFVEETMCDGQIDVFFAGHDHNRQWLGKKPGCSTTFVVSGAGGKTTDFRHSGNPTAFEDDTTEGFVWVGLEGDVMTAYFYDRHGNESGPFVTQR